MGLSPSRVTQKDLDYRAWDRKRDLSVLNAYGKCPNGHHKSWFSANGRYCSYPQRQNPTCFRSRVPNRTKYPKIAEHLNSGWFNKDTINPKKVIALLDDGVCKNTQKPHKNKEACDAAGKCEWIRIDEFKEKCVSLDNQIEAKIESIKDQDKIGWTSPCLNYYCDEGWVRAGSYKKKPCPQCRGSCVDPRTDRRWKRDNIKRKIYRLEKEREVLFEVTLDKLEAMLEKDDIVPKPIEANLADPKSPPAKRKLDDAISRRLPELPCPAAAVPAAAGTDHAPLLCMSAVFLLFMIFVRRWTAKRY